MGQADRLREGLAQLERHTREMQESVMQIRMLPISFTFSRFRLVHDLSTQMGKKIELRMSGETPKLTKRSSRRLAIPGSSGAQQPDHGIEMPDQRIAVAGNRKPAWWNSTLFTMEAALLSKYAMTERAGFRPHTQKGDREGADEESAKMSDQQICTN